MVLACGGCDPFMVLMDDAEEPIMSTDNKGNDVGVSVMSNMEVLANASLMERNTKSSGLELESIPEALSEKSDSEEREVDAGCGTPEKAERRADSQNTQATTALEENKGTTSESKASPEQIVVTVKVEQEKNDAQVTFVETKDDIVPDEVSLGVESLTVAEDTNTTFLPVECSDRINAALETTEREDFLRAPSPPLKIAPSLRAMQTNEQDYTKDPTDLYLMIQQKEWQKAVESIEKNAHQAATWVSRKESSGELRWRLLPIHAAVIFGAPESVVQALLKVFPDGAQHKEDQGMLPLHLAFRMGSAESVVTLLLSAFPDSINVRDRKGRTALELAESTNGPNKAAFIRALKKGPNVAKSSRGPESSSVNQLEDIREDNEKNTDALKQDTEAKQNALQQEVLTLQKALVRKQENSQLLVDHIASLEAKIAELDDPDRKNLDIKLNNLLSSGMDIEAIETIYKDEFAILQERNRYLESKVTDIKHDKEMATDALKQTLKIFETRKAEWNAEKKLSEGKMTVLEEDCSGLRENVSILEEQIRKRSISEKALAAQMSVLAEQLRETTSDSNSSTEAFSARIRVLETERDDLRFSVNRLSKKLYFVAGLVGSVSKDQIAVVEEALQHENKAALAASTQEKMMLDVKEHSELVQNVKNLGDEIKELLSKHAAHMGKTCEARKAVVDVVEEQSRQIISAEERREELIKGMAGFKNQMLEVLDSVFDELPKEMPEDHNLVDKVLEKMIAVKEEDELETERDDIVVEEEKTEKD